MTNQVLAPAMNTAFVEDQEDTVRRRSEMRQEAYRRRLLPLLAICGILLVWEAGVRYFDVKPYIAPAPSAIAIVLASKWRILLDNLVPTAIEAVAGFVLGNTIAVLIASSFVWRRSIEQAFFPAVVIVNSIPVVAKAPILVRLLGNGIEPKIAISALVCFFPMLVNMTRGLRDVDPQHLELMHVLSASPREIFFKLRIKNSLPYFVAAMKVAAPGSVVGAIVGEWIGSLRGIGALIIQATYNFDSPLLYATIVVGSTFSALFFAVVGMVERRLLRWRPGRVA